MATAPDHPGGSRSQRILAVDGRALTLRERHISALGIRRLAETLLTVAALLLLRRLGLLADTPLWVLPGLIALGVAARAAADVWWLRKNTPWRLPYVIAVQITAATAVIYATGWGPALAIGYVFIVVDNVEALGGTMALRPTVIGVLIGIVLGQVAIAAGVAPTLIDPPEVHGLALLAALGFAFAARLVDVTTVGNEQSKKRLEQRVLERTAQLDRALGEAKLLSDIVSSTSGEDDLGRILTAALDRLSLLIPFTGGSIALVEGEDLVIRAAFGSFAESALGQRLPRDRGQSWKALETAEPFLGNDLYAAGLKPTNPIRSNLAVPLVWQGRAYGLLEVDSVEANAFDSTHLSLMQRVAAELSGPIELARRYGIEVRAVAEAAEAQRRFRRAKDEAERANRAKSEFLSRMSHELRTPLNSILGFAQLLEMDSLTTGQREGVEHILHGGQHLLALINEVLDIAQIEAGRLVLSREPVRVQDVVEESLELIAPLAAQRNVRLDGRQALTYDGRLLADRQRFKQVLLNLLSNAVKYNRDGGAVILTCEDVPRGRVRLTVRDTGPGIPRDKLGRLFTPFERLSSQVGGVEGTGIGLALSKGLVELMDGEVGVESVVGKGSAFWVELPAVDGRVRVGAGG